MDVDAGRKRMHEGQFCDLPNLALLSGYTEGRPRRSHDGRTCGVRRAGATERRSYDRNPDDHTSVRACVRVCVCVFEGACMLAPLAPFTTRPSEAKHERKSTPSFHTIANGLSESRSVFGMIDSYPNQWTYVLASGGAPPLWQREPPRGRFGR